MGYRRLRDVVGELLELLALNLRVRYREWRGVRGDFARGLSVDRERVLEDSIAEHQRRIPE